MAELSRIKSKMNCSACACACVCVHPRMCEFAQTAIKPAALKNALFVCFFLLLLFFCCFFKGMTHNYKRVFVCFLFRNEKLKVT